MPINKQINLLLNELSVFELELPTGPNKLSREIVLFR